MIKYRPKEVDFMYTLFLDTHDELITVALYSEKNIIVKDRESYHSHAVYFVPMIRDILRENDLTVKNIKDIVCVNGPGSFTGLRIGLSVAKTLAYSLSIPIYLISSLESYLVSSNLNGKKMCVVEDTKGYYISGDGIEEQYVTDISKYNDYVIVDKSLDIEKVVKCALSKTSVNPHLVRANYVKEIEVLK